MPDHHAHDTEGTDPDRYTRRERRRRRSRGAVVPTAVSQQLCLPLEPGTEVATTLQLRGGHHSADLRVELWGAGARLSMTMHSGESIVSKHFVEVVWSHGVLVAWHGGESSGRSLGLEPIIDGRDGAVVSALLTPLRRRFSNASHWTEKAWDLLARAHHHVLSAIPQRFIDAARRFPEHLRFEALVSLTAEKTGRLLQLAEVAPGLARLLFELARRGGTARTRAIVDAIADGETLARTINETLEVWAQTEGLDGPLPPPLLIRKAGPLVPPRDLFALASATVVPEDIPSCDAASNHRWFRLLANLWRAAAERGLTGHPRFIRLSKCVSRYPLEASAIADPSDIIDCCYAMGRMPDRKTPRFLRDVYMWKTQGRDLPDAMPLPAPIGPWQEKSDVINPITTIGELRAEARRMHSCVAAMARRAATGALLLFSATVRGRPLTIALRRRAGRWRLDEIRGANNGAVEEAEEQRVFQWFLANKSLLQPETTQPEIVR